MSYLALALTQRVNFSWFFSLSIKKITKKDKEKTEANKVSIKIKCYTSEANSNKETRKREKTRRLKVVNQNIRFNSPDDSRKFKCYDVRDEDRLFTQSTSK